LLFSPFSRVGLPDDADFAGTGKKEPNDPIGIFVRLRVAYLFRQFCVSLRSRLNHAALAAGVVGVPGDQMDKIIAALVTLGLSSFALTSAASADEITALFPGSLKHANAQLIPQFERSSGNKVNAIYSTAGAVADKVRNGEAADIAVSGAGAMDQLTKQGKLLSDSTAALVKVGAGALVRKGATKPDISTLERLKAALLAAKAISYTDPALGGPVGIYIGKLMDKLGIGSEMKRKTKLSGPGDAVSTTVVNGEADIGFIMINEILADPRVDFIGPLPPSVQYYTTFSGGVVAASKHQDAARRFVAFLSSSASRAVLEKLGFEAP
jgi:molybdate transport system substrate-binding protein